MNAGKSQQEEGDGWRERPAAAWGGVCKKCKLNQKEGVCVESFVSAAGGGDNG